VNVPDATDPQAARQAFDTAVAVAGRAPSIHNSQPWRWRVVGAAGELYRQRSRQLQVTDPDGRLLTLSCGGALHHARVALAAEGWVCDVRRLPAGGDPDLLARVHLLGRSAPSSAAVRQAHAVQLRYTDRRPVTTTRVDDSALTAIVAAAEAEGVWLNLLRPDQVVELAAAAEYAMRTERAEHAWLAELAYWTGGTRPTGTGVPDSAIPERATETTVPSRDFGHPGALAVSAEHDRAASFGLLFGAEDAPLGWLRAGEALSSAWLTASELGVSVVPMSAPVEVTPTREALRRLLSRVGHPYLVVRLGIADTDDGAPPLTPRLSPAQITDPPG
jgi:nitroreductase